MAKLRPVKCLYCSEQFDRDTEEFVVVGKRYAHKSCQENHDNNKTKEQKDKEELEQYIVSLYGYINALHRKQMKDLSNAGYSYSGMHKTLIYFFEIKRNKVDKARGIGLIPFVYKEAFDYYFKLHTIEERAKNISTEQLKHKVKVVRIPPPSVKRKSGRVIDLDSLEEGLKNE